MLKEKISSDQGLVLYAEELIAALFEILALVDKSITNAAISDKEKALIEFHKYIINLATNQNISFDIEIFNIQISKLLGYLQQDDILNNLNALSSRINEIDSIMEQYETKYAPNNIERDLNTISKWTDIFWGGIKSVGIFLQKVHTIITPFLKVALFPVAFFIDGLQQIYGSYKSYREQTSNGRADLKFNLFTIASLVAAATVTALAVTNPLAIPIIFFGMVGMGLYKAVSDLNKLNSQINDTHSEYKKLTQAYQDINNKKNIINQTPEISETETNTFIKISNNSYKSAEGKKKEITLLDNQLAHIKAQQNRLNYHYQDLLTQRREQKKGVIEGSISYAALVVAVVGAALTLAFPPVGAIIFTVGLFIFAANAGLFSGMKFTKWIKDKISKKQEPVITSNAESDSLQSLDNIEEQQIAAPGTSSPHAVANPNGAASTHSSSSPAKERGSVNAVSNPIPIPQVGENHLSSIESSSTHVNTSFYNNVESGASGSSNNLSFFSPLQNSLNSQESLDNQISSNLDKQSHSSNSTNA